MAIENPKDIFEADAAALLNTMTSYGGACGFSIPEYQREYSWDKGQVKRLLENCLYGFSCLSDRQQKSTVTFLGTIILIEAKRESFIEGTSLSVVDGQQRLITLVLLCCALIDELEAHKTDITEKLSGDEERNWIRSELKHQTRFLYKCTNGELEDPDGNVPYPRIVRQGDNRGFEGEYEYVSSIAKVLHKFSKCYKDKVTFNMSDASSVEEKRLAGVYEYIKSSIHTLLYEGQKNCNPEPHDIEWEPIDDDFERGGIKNLFDRLSTIEDENSQRRVLDKVVGISGLVRLILFSSYIIRRVVLAKVVTKDEDSAFNIFEALNTTGEPLTALETLKPSVVQFENDNTPRGYGGSESEISFKALQDSLNYIKLSEKRQKETKELITSFALFYNGTKLSHDLNRQRVELRKNYEKLSSLEVRRKFITSIKDLQEFRNKFWKTEGIKQLSVNTLNHEELSFLQLCLMLIANMKTSLAVPILARYWIEYQSQPQMHTPQGFVKWVKAVTAFIAIRRSATGATENIDGDLRELMSSDSQPLCLGENYTNTLISIDDLRKKLIGYLKNSCGITDKQTWLNKACSKPLAKHSTHLCRFLIFAAAHNSRMDDQNPGLWKKSRPSHELNYFDFDTKWLGGKYETVEHIAPDSHSDGWDPAIYEGDITKHKIGNLILLPQKENSAVGKSNWEKKKKFYGVLVAEEKSEVESLLESAEDEGFTFTKKTKTLLGTQEHLPLLKPIVNVNDWSMSIIENRTRNILELAWDNISPWLFSND